MEGEKAVVDEVEEGLLGLFEHLAGGQYPLDESLAALRIAAKAQLAPDDGEAERALRKVVGSFEVIEVDKMPQRLFIFEQVFEDARSIFKIASCLTQFAQRCPQDVVGQRFSLRID